MESHKVNSQQYWNDRFLTRDWEENKGQEQTRYFYSLLLKLLPDWLKTAVRQKQYSIVDFGCAQGQGIPLLAAELNSHIKGIDFSEHAILYAKEKYPQFHFEVADIWKYDKPTDVSILSNVIEHFPNPFELLDQVASITQKYMIVMVPLEEKNLMDEHCFTFLYQNIPTQIRDLQLVYFTEYDCRDDEEQLFLAKQVLALYSRDRKQNQCLTIGQVDGLLSMREQQAKEVRSYVKHYVQPVLEKFLYVKELESKNKALSDQMQQLKNTYELTAAENARIKNSRTYRIAEMQKALLDKLHLMGMCRFAISVRRCGVKESIRQWRAQKEISGLVREEWQLVSESAFNGKLSGETAHMLSYKKICRNELLKEWSDTTWEIAHILGHRRYKGIVVYPHAVHWEPVQRPQQFLRSFAKEGYLCFFCEWNTEGEGIREIEQNVVIVYGEEYLLAALQDQCPIVLMTYHRQAVFCDLLPHKVIWFDILDNLDFFAGAAEHGVSEIYDMMLKKADLVTYSADRLMRYAGGRKDAVKLNNGVCLEDFQTVSPDSRPIDEMERIKEKGSKIIGYFGAIEEWFDLRAVEYLLDHTEYEIVLIGRIGIDLGRIKNKRCHLIHALPYQELKHYARYFDVAMIPFIVNHLTNSVSPVKFFEYMALMLPVVSSDIHEMQQYQNEFVHIYHNYDEMVSSIRFLCSHKADTKLLHQIARQNTWEQRMDVVLAEMKKKPERLRAMANISSYGCIAAESVTFFKYDGTTYYSGGAERYLLDLDEVCRELGIQFRVYQYAEYDWVRFYQNVEVVGLGAKENDVNHYCASLTQEMESRFAVETAQSGALNIYSPFYILSRKDRIPSIGISHGISWDSEYNHYTDGNTFWQTNKGIIDAASYCDYMISVDTNTCNWFQTLDYHTGRKIRYVPNYVDHEEFYPKERDADLKDKIIITYPRRLYGARGLYVVLEILDDVLEAFPNVEFHFVGKGFEVDTRHVMKKIKKWGERVRWYSKTPDTMHEIYRYTDITLIPTMYSEGTSLSCLEALSSGNAVIATRVGGLPDLIISGYNGILAEPDQEAIRQAIFTLLENPEKMKYLKENAVKTAKAFSKIQWKTQWKQAIQRAIGDRKTAPYQEAVRCLIQLSAIEDLNKETVISVISDWLESGKYVYIACKNNPLKAKSYKRLQFINQDEDLYFQPEEMISAKTL